MDGSDRAVADPAALYAACAMYVDRVTAEVVTALYDAGIPAILLKGPSIARWLYPAGGRVYRDTDLLVPPAQFAAGEEVLRSLGFTDLVEDFHPCERVAKVVETAFIRDSGPGARPGGKVDLHRNLPGLPVPESRVWEALDARCEAMVVGDVEVRAVDRIGVALHVVVHAVQHGFTMHTAEDLRRAIVALPLEGWQEVARLAGRLGIAGVVGLGLRHLPEGADLAGRLGLPQASPSPEPRGVQSLSRLRSAPTIADKARIVRWAVIPSPAKVRWVSTPQQPLVAGYVRYWRGLAKSTGPAVRFVLARRVASSNRLLLLEAAICLALARLGIAALPFRWLTRALGLRQVEASGQDRAATPPASERVAWALDRMRRRAPWSANCLAQALAGTVMLRRRGVTSTLRLGVVKEGTAHLQAHAWLSSGDVIVAGGQDLERFTPLATFS